MTSQLQQQRETTHNPTCLSFHFPLPPRSHSKNSRQIWQDQRRIWRTGLQQAILMIKSEYPGRFDVDDPTITVPFRVHVLWRYYEFFKFKDDANRQYPDFDNMVARCAHIFDALQHTGVIANDHLLRSVSYDTESVPSEEEQQLVLTLRPIQRYVKEAADE